MQLFLMCKLCSLIRWKVLVLASLQTGIIIKVLTKWTPSQYANSTYMCQRHQQLLVFLIPLIWAMTKNSITRDNYVPLAVNNTSVNVEWNNSVIVEDRKKNKNILMGFPCHMANNNASKAIQVFEEVADSSNVEELLVGAYVHFENSPKRKIFLLSFVSFVISTIVKPSSSAVSDGLVC